jgi:hypothetical protein
MDALHSQQTLMTRCIACTQTQYPPHLMRSGPSWHSRGRDTQTRAVENGKYSPLAKKRKKRFRGRWRVGVGENQHPEPGTCFMSYFLFFLKKNKIKTCFLKKIKKKFFFKKIVLQVHKCPEVVKFQVHTKKGKDLPRNSHIHCSALVIRDLHISSKPVLHVVHSTASWKCKDQNSVPA